jgi:hypothetical protein
MKNGQDRRIRTVLAVFCMREHPRSIETLNKTGVGARLGAYAQDPEDVGLDVVVDRMNGSIAQDGIHGVGM